MESQADGFAYCQDGYSLGILKELVDEEERTKWKKGKKKKKKRKKNESKGEKE